MRDTGPMLWIGAPCHACRREDFLPLVCTECKHAFCAEHFRQESHACPSPVRDILGPCCPLCGDPPRGWARDASAEATQHAMEQHWAARSLDTGGCRALIDVAPGAPRSATRRCSARACHTVLYVAIRVRKAMG